MSPETTELGVPAGSELTVRRDAIGVGGLLVGSTVLALSSGPLGLATALIFALSGLLVPSLLAFASGQLLFLAVAGSPAPLELAVFQLGLFAVLTEPLRFGELVSRPTLVSAAIFSALGLGLTSLSRQVELLSVALVLAAVTAVLIYGCHRYVLVTLDVPISTMDTNDDPVHDE